MNIRPIEQDDNATVANIIRSVMTECRAVGTGFSINDPEVDDMFGAYASPRAAFYVVESNDRVLGCGGFGPLTGGDGETCELRKMYFMPELRGLGMGAELLKHILDAAAKSGFTSCYLETLTSMEQANRLYGKHGFKYLDKPMGNTGHTACGTWMARSI